MRAILVASVCGLAVGFGAADEKKSVVREIGLKGLELNIKERGKVSDPTKITSAEELAKAIPNKETAEKIGKQVDFSKEYLLLFKWSGSGQDKLVAGGDDKSVGFAYTPGRTRDLRQHVHLYALAKGAGYSVMQ